MGEISKEPILWIAFACYLEWGIIHILAGFTTIFPAYKYEIYKYLTTICQLAPESVKEEAKVVEKWNVMNVRILIQHGFNLLFVGLYSFAIAFVVTFDYPNRYGFYLGLWPWFADVAYFIGIDMVEYGSVPAQAQTFIISTALLLTAISVKQEFDDIVPMGEFIITLIIPSCLILAAIINKILFLTGMKTKLGEDANK